MTDKQPDALRLADVLDLLWLDGKTPQQAAAELRRLHAELAEPDALREKMSDILRRTAIALKGEPDDLALHSWHDLPEVARTLRYEVDAIAAGDGVLIEEQALLLRECRHALDDLLRDKPMLAAKQCGTTTLGNLRAMLYDYRPQGVFGGNK